MSPLPDEKDMIPTPLPQLQYSEEDIYADPISVEVEKAETPVKIDINQETQDAERNMNKSQ